MPDAIIVKVEPAQLQVKPGATAIIAVTVRNRTEEVGHYQLALDGIQPGWADVTPDQVSAFPMQEAQAQITLHPPADARGATYHVTVRAVSQEAASIVGRAALDVDVPAAVQPPPVTMPPPPMTVPEARTHPPTTPPPIITPPVAPRTQTASQIEVLAEPIKDSKLPLPATQWKLSLRNAGNVLDTFAFSIANIKPQWVRLEPTQLTLKPDERGTATLTITPTPDTPAGSYPFVVRTFSHLNMNQRTEITLKFDVRAASGFQLSIDPKEAESQGQREFRVVLTSSATSNTDLWLNLSAGDQDNACDYTFEQPQVFVPAKQSVVSTLRVRPRATLNANERKTYTFKVTATERNGVVPPLTSDPARLTQVAAAPLRLVLRPQVQSGDLDADYALVIGNPAGVETSLVLSADDPEAGCEYAFSPARVSLPPGGETQIKLKVRARTNFEAEGQKEFPFIVSATRFGEMTPIATIAGKFQQKQLKPIRLTLIPTQLSSAGSAQFIVRANNPRLRATQILLAAHDEADALAFSFSPKEINLSPNAEGSTTVTARPKDKLMQGEQRRVHKFTVTAAVEGAATPPTINGTLAQIPGVDVTGAAGSGLKLFVWLLRWLVVLLIVLFLVTLVFAGVEAAPQLGNADLVKLLNGIPFMSPTFAKRVVDLSPFSFIARPIVQILLVIVSYFRR